MKEKLEPIQTFVLDEDTPEVLLLPTGERQIGENLGEIAPDHRKRYRWAAKRLRALGAETVLDAGSGGGYGSWILADKGLMVHAIDIEPNCVKFAEDRWAHTNVVSRSTGDLLTADLPAADAVVCFEVLEHLDAEALLDRFSAMGARMLICSVPNENITPFATASFPFHLRHYTPVEFTELLEPRWPVARRLCQIDKWEGSVFDGWDGRTIIAECSR